jgi:RsiW-degrading membrane proteinase PrsW (M82 family)
MLAAIAVIGIVTQAPTAIFLETKLHSSTGNLLDVFTIGIPEELAKAIPIVVVAWIWRHYWHTQTPRDYLFLGAVSGLVFGAAEAVHYFTNVLGSLSGNVNGLDLQDLTIQYIWRFLTDPIDHAMWAGITGYFIGLAITGQNRKYSLGLVGIAIAAVLHGLNDWNPVNGHVAWVLVTLISVILFLGYARAGAWLPQQALASSPDLAPSAPGPPGSVPPAPWAAGSPGQVPPAHPGPAGYGAPAGHGAPAGYGPPAGHGAPAGYGPPAGHGAPAGYGPPAMPEQASSAGPPVSREAWWQHPPAAGGPTVPPPPQPAHASPAPSDATAPHATAPHAAVPHSAAAQPTVVPRKSAPKPWWEQ